MAKNLMFFDEVGEWLIENGQVSENCMLSIIGDAVDRHRNLYERLGDEAMQIIQDLSGSFVFQKYWKNARVWKSW